MGYVRVGRPCGLTCALHALVVVVAALLAAYATACLHLLLGGQAYRPSGFALRDYAALLYFGPGSDPLVATPRLSSAALRVEPRSGPDGYLLTFSADELAFLPQEMRDGLDHLNLYLRVSFRYPFSSMEDVLLRTYAVGPGGDDEGKAVTRTRYVRSAGPRGTCEWPLLYGGAAEDYYAPPACAPGFEEVAGPEANGTAPAGLTLQVNETFIPLPGRPPETARYFYLRFYFYLLFFALALWAFYAAGRHLVVWCSALDGGTRRYPERVAYG